jgi:hypothetical protein
MAVNKTAVAISKVQTWHAKQERYDTVYHFEGPLFGQGDPRAKQIVDKLVAEEKKIYGDNVTFVGGRVWSTGGTIEENVTLGLFDLTGTGTVAGAPVFGEAAVLIQWECTRLNVLGRKVYLRKYHRVGRLPGGGTVAEFMAQGRSVLDGSFLTIYSAYADAVLGFTIPAGGDYRLISPTGRKPKEVQASRVYPFTLSREYRRN